MGRAWAVDNPSGDNNEFARAEAHAVCAFVIHCDIALDDEEKIIGIVMFVIGILADKFYDHDVIVVITRDDFRVPMGVKKRQFFSEIYFLHDGLWVRLESVAQTRTKAVCVCGPCK